jgi:quercetin dioxygenase-like cupin family protein
MTLDDGFLEPAGQEAWLASSCRPTEKSHRICGMETSALHGQKAKLADLVSYQADAIVSKTLVKGETGSVSIFAFDRGQELSEHTVPFDALVCVVDGEAEIRISQALHRVRAGEAIVMPANQPHAVKALQRFKMMLSMVKA